MVARKDKKFHFQSFTSFFVTFSFFIISISGIFLYFAPPGRVAHWSNWTFLGLTKDQWQAVHTIFSFLFVIFSGFHIYFNWSILMLYFKKKMQKGINRKRELGWSSAIILVVIVLTIMAVPPFSTIMDWGEALSNSWSNEETEPPIPHAELMPLNELVKTANLKMTDVLNHLKEAGIEVDSLNIVIKDLAEKNNMSPKELFAKMQIPEQKTQSPETESHTIGTGAGFGYGSMTIEQVCEKYQVPLEEGLKRLKSKNIEAKPDDNVRKLATDYSVLPIDLVSIIQSKSINE